MFNSPLMLNDLVILGLSCPSLFFFGICFTTNRAMMSDCTITCCEIYVLWCCFRSVHCIVLYCVLDWIKDREKWLTWSNKEQRASFFFDFRERERERVVILDLDLREFVILVNLIKLLGWFLSWRLVSFLWENVLSEASKKGLFMPPIRSYHVKHLMRKQYTLPHKIITQLKPKSEQHISDQKPQTGETAPTPPLLWPT